MSTSSRRLWLVAAVALASAACDQGTKQLAVAALRGRAPIEYLDQTVRFVYAENTGAWGSLGASWPAPLKQALFVLLPIIYMLAAAAHVARRRDATRSEFVAVALLVGGGFGNIADRIAHGYVVDFLWVGRGWLSTNVFNVADLAIMAGVCLLLIAARRRPVPVPVAATDLAKPNGPASS